MRVAAQFVRDNGRLLWREDHSIEEHGCVYLCQEPGTDKHMVYKLSKVPESNPAQWTWLSLWNSSTIAGSPTVSPYKRNHFFTSIEEAVGAMLDQYWRVWKAHFDGTSFK